MRLRDARRKTLGLAIVIGSVGGVVAQERQPPPGIEYTLDLSTGIVTSDNLENVADPNGRSTLSRTNLTFGARSQTKVSDLALTFGGRFEAGYFAQDDTTTSVFEDPFATLAYRREGANANFSFLGTYRETDVSRSRVVEDEFENEDLIEDDGTRVDTDLRFSFETNPQGPWGTDVDLRYRTRNFNGVTSDELTDTEFFSIDAGLRLLITPSATLRLTASQSQLIEDDDVETEQETTSYGANLVYEISRATRVNAGLSAVRIETEQDEAGGRSTDVDEGPSFNFGIEHDRPNGQISATFSNTLIRNGRRQTIRVARDLELKRGELSFSVGATQTNGNGFDPLLALTYSGDLKRGSYRIRFSQNANTDTDGDSFINTRLSANYRHEIDRVSGLELDLSLTESDAQGDDGTDRSRTNLGVTYTRDLTHDWQLRTGYEYGLTETNDGDGRRRNTLFATINRSFSLRP
ncbi:hypothetical protein [Actibacterium sp. 188UL27-1]|uniref:hypothetical protein n=1 Tax=Actibacterium sp. 188UL27-1 TaxID=2786961 RepID=UPI0019570217|nr:hypothetical protein [Actibacterium sp. 188UL27-1]MBM7068982.1 hypothetical protein [Actibacterium sp. 188UL27-1]